MNLKNFSLAFAVCAMMLAACGNASKTDADSTQTGEVEVTELAIVVEDDSCDAESVENDSIVTRGGTASEGFGRCSKCNCREFEGRGQTCRNCGHAYKAHY